MCCSASACLYTMPPMGELCGPSLLLRLIYQLVVICCAHPCRCMCMVLPFMLGTFLCLCCLPFRCGPCPARRHAWLASSAHL